MGIKYHPIGYNAYDDTAQVSWSSLLLR